MANLPAESLDGDNDLAERILRLAERLRPYGGTILLALAAAVVAGAAWSLVSAQSAATRAQSWDGYLAALSTGNPAGFQDVMTRYPDSPAADWARVVLAEMSLREGMDLAFSDRPRSKARLEAAEQLYGMVVAKKPQGLVAERAVFGLAKAREGLGMLDDARRGYDALAREYPFGGLADLAANRAASLGTDPTQNWYRWFASQDVAAKTPEPDDSTKSGDSDAPNGSPAPNGEPGDTAKPSPEPEKAEAAKPEAAKPVPE